MEKIKLGDVCKVQGGYAFKSDLFSKNNIPIIRIGNIQENKVTVDNDICYTEEFLDNHPEFEIKRNDILIAMSGATVGKVGKYSSYQKALLNQRVGKFIVKEELDENFLYFLLKSPLFEKYILNNAFGCAQPNISSRKIEEFEFYKYELDKQKEIATVLDKVQEVINIRKKQIEDLDGLIKSQFIEMFGALNNNHIEWQVADFQDVVYFQEGPGVRNWQFRDSGIKLINIRNLIDDNLVLENTNTYLSEQEVNQKYKHFLLNVGDYVMASSGVTWGKIAEISEKHIPLCLNTSIIRLRPYDENIVSKQYLFNFIKSDAFRMQINKLITGSAQPNFGPTHLKKLSILLPPIQLQNKFEKIVEKANKSKLQIQKSIEEVQKLQESLMSKYFG